MDTTLSRQHERRPSRAHVARHIRLATTAVALIAVLGTGAIGALVATEIPGSTANATTAVRSSESAPARRTVTAKPATSATSSAGTKEPGTKAASSSGTRATTSTTTTAPSTASSGAATTSGAS